MFAKNNKKMSKTDLAKEESELKEMMRTAIAETPTDKRNLTVIHFKGGNEIHETHLSADRKNSSFENARVDLMNKLKKQRTGQSLGWKKGDIIVYKEKTNGVSFDWLKKHPDQFEKFKKYGHQLLDYDAKNTVFVVQHKDGTRTKYTVWGKPFKVD